MSQARCSTEAGDYGELPGLVLGQATVPDPARVDRAMTIYPGLSKRLRCMTVVHEYGHWLGLERSRMDVKSPS